MKTIKFFTFGCKVNQYETQSLREQFLRKGYKEIYNGKKADTYLINTCTVTDKADRESLYAVRRAKRENPAAKIIVTGCLAELDGDRIKETCRAVTIIKNSNKNKLFAGDRCPIGSANGAQLTSQMVRDFGGRTRAFLKIQDGCDNFCSYCKVPLVRGRPKSRPLTEIIKEAERLAKSGFKEIVLCGICLGAYGRDLSPKLTLIDVIAKLEKITGLSRIRLSSIEPNDISQGLIKKMASSAKLCRHLHVPLQSGDNEILKKMNRRYTAEAYLRIIVKIKKALPQAAITTDVLVGFPGESENNFQNTVRLIRKILPLKVHIFPYSPRKGTKAFNLEPVAGRIIKKRISLLKEAASACALEYEKQFLNKRLEVLIEAKSKDKPGYWQGYTDNYLQLFVKSRRNLKNQFVSLQVKRRRLP